MFLDFRGEGFQPKESLDVDVRELQGCVVAAKQAWSFTAQRSSIEAQPILGLIGIAKRARRSG